MVEALALGEVVSNTSVEMINQRQDFCCPAMERLDFRCHGDRHWAVPVFVKSSENHMEVL